jgi:lipoprotein signal peptidase
MTEQPPTDPPPGAPSAARARLLRVLVATAVTVVVVDQLSKAWAVEALTGRGRVDLVGDLFGLRLTRNPGAAFSLATGATWIFTILATIVVVIIARIARDLGSRAWAVTLGLLMGGATGNLIDRLVREPGFARGHVIDFFELPHYPIFNVADSCIVTAAILIGWLGLRGVSVDGPPRRLASGHRRQGRRPAHDPPDGRVTESRSLPVPDGLAGERVDAGLARLLGLSRNVTAQLAEDGHVLLDGVAVAKSARLRGGSWLDVTLPSEERADAAPPEPVEGLRIVHDDDDLVVVDKPVGVAAHASPGWTGPTVVGGLAAAGFRIATSGAAERQGVVHRLDVGTSGLMVVAKSERAYSVLKQAFRERTVEKVYHAVVQGHPDPLSGTIDAPIGRHPPPTTSGPSSPAGGRASRTTRRSRRSGRRRWSRSTSRPAAPTRSACTSPRCGTPASATSRTARTRRSPSASASPASGCTRCASASPTRHRRVGRVHQRVPARPRHRPGPPRHRLTDGPGTAEHPLSTPEHRTDTGRPPG